MTNELRVFSSLASKSFQIQHYLFLRNLSIPDDSSFEVIQW